MRLIHEYNWSNKIKGVIQNLFQDLIHFETEIKTFKVWQKIFSEFVASLTN